MERALFYDNITLRTRVLDFWRRSSVWNVMETWIRAVPSNNRDSLCVTKIVVPQTPVAFHRNGFCDARGDEQLKSRRGRMKHSLQSAKTEILLSTR